jgi:ornithine--oxo-acid transaminase
MTPPSDVMVTDITVSGDVTSTAAQYIERDEAHAAHTYHPLPVVLREGSGVWVTDVDGRRYLDCLAGYSALNFGHGHPVIVAAADEQRRRGRRECAQAGPQVGLRGQGRPA